MLIKTLTHFYVISHAEPTCIMIQIRMYFLFHGSPDITTKKVAHCDIVLHLCMVLIEAL